MYGMVNKGIRDMVIQNYGIDAWHKIRKEAKCEQDQFTSIQPYEDSITYDLVAAAAKVLGAPAHDILVNSNLLWNMMQTRCPSCVRLYGSIILQIIAALIFI